MSKICPITKEKVLYLECLECENRNDCKDIENSASEEDVQSNENKP